MIKLLSRIWHVLSQKQKTQAVFITALLVFGSFLEALSIGMVLPMLFVVTSDNPLVQLQGLPIIDMISHLSRYELVLVFIAAVVTIFLLKNLYFMFVVWRQGRLVYGLQAELSQLAYDRYLEQTLEEQTSSKSSHLIRDVATEVQQFTSYAALPSMGLIMELPIIFTLTLVLILVEPIGAVLTVTLAGGLITAHYITLAPHLSRWGQVRQQAEANRVRSIQQTASCFPDIKLRRDETYFSKHFASENVHVALMAEKLNFWQSMPRYWIEFFLLVTILGLVFYLVSKGSSGSEVVSTLGIFAAVAFKLAPSANRVVAHIQALRYAEPVVERLTSMLSPNWKTKLADTGKWPSDASRNAVDNWRRLVLRDVSYSHPDMETATLRSVNLSIDRGSVIGLVGPSGAGKTTLANIIMGLRLPASGSLELDRAPLVDGDDINPDLLSAWQRNIGYVPQNFSLNDTSIVQNIAFRFHPEEIDANSVHRALTDAQIEEFVATLPEGLDTLVGERGVRLSGGQGQRIAIARTFYLNAGVIVFDEATSALDEATQGSVIASLLSKRGEKTIIIVAHRISTLQLCDYIVEMHDGSISRTGTPEKVLKNL